MAKKKEIKEEVDEQAVQTASVEMQEQVAETPETPLPEIEETKPAGKTKKEKVVIPATDDKILKSYPDYKELYIDRFGGVFTADTQPSLVEDAILYQNPYYNK